MALVATNAWYCQNTAYVNFRMPFEKRYFLCFTEKETEAGGEEPSPQLQGESLGQLELGFRSFVFQPHVELTEPIILTLPQ